MAEGVTMPDRDNAEIIKKLQGKIPDFGKRPMMWRDVEICAVRSKLALVFVPGLPSPGAMVAGEKMRGFLQNVGQPAGLANNRAGLIVLASGLAKVDRVGVAFHELAHYLLGHDGTTAREIQRQEQEANFVEQVARHGAAWQQTQNLKVSKPG